MLGSCREKKLAEGNPTPAPTAPIAGNITLKNTSLLEKTSSSMVFLSLFKHNCLTSYNRYVQKIETACTRMLLEFI